MMGFELSLLSDLVDYYFLRPGAQAGEALQASSTLASDPLRTTMQSRSPRKGWVARAARALGP